MARIWGGGEDGRGRHPHYDTPIREVTVIVPEFDYGEPSQTGECPECGVFIQSSIKYIYCPLCGKPTACG